MAFCQSGLPREGQLIITECGREPGIFPGLRVYRHQPQQDRTWDPGRFQLFFSPRQEEESLIPSGRELLPELSPYGLPNAFDLEFLSLNPGEIPEAWKAYRVSFFGTTYADGWDCECVPELFFRAGTWHIALRWISAYWNGDQATLVFRP